MIVSEDVCFPRLKPVSAGAEPLRQVAANRVETDPLLSHAVARAKSHRLVLQRVEVDGDAVGGADLVLPPVAPADGPGVIEVHGPLLAQVRGKVAGHR